MRQAGWKNMKYAMVLEQMPGNWCAYVPDLPGCIATGPTLEDTRRFIVEAIQFHIEILQRRGPRVPEPSAVADTVEVAA
jgi:predicted RNase H-like HicB family nuclease